MISGVLPVSAEVARELDGGELARVMGLPRGRGAAGVPGLAAAVSWYVDHGAPWVATRTLDVAGLDAGAVRLSEGATLGSRVLARRFAEAEADLVVLVLVSAGPEAGEEAKRRWATRPEESFALDRVAAAVTEHLLARSSIVLCQTAEPQGRFVLSPMSPGHEEWNVAEQRPLFALLPAELRGPIEVLPSGMLRPVASQLSVFGVTRGEVTSHRYGVPCRSCSCSPCSYRRAAFEL